MISFSDEIALKCASSKSSASAATGESRKAQFAQSGGSDSSRVVILVQVSRMSSRF
jgi:hypothetical protein